MGKAHSGKTSMRSIIFANYLARDTMRLSPTLDVEHHHVRFLGDLVLNLWDCGGQDAFYESYFERDRETIFRSVEMLIYVFDIESDCPEKDFDHFAGVLEAIEENSPDARIFVLVHKMDLVSEDERDLILRDRTRLIEEACAGCGVLNFTCFGTSIWDETLYKAWSEIVTNLIPNIRLLEKHLDDFCRICDADEVVLFERATFLVISHATAIDVIGGGGNEYENKGLTAPSMDETGDVAAASEGAVAADGGAALEPETINSINDNDNEAAAGANTSSPSPIITSPQNPAATDTTTTLTTDENNRPQRGVVSSPSSRRATHFDAHRFEKISNIVKQFKLSCGKTQSQFQGMEVRNSRFTAFIDAFTVNTYIMVIVSDPNIHTAATHLNIRNARRHFERFIPRT